MRSITEWSGLAITRGVIGPGFSAMIDLVVVVIYLVICLFIYLLAYLHFIELNSRTNLILAYYNV